MSVLLAAEVDGEKLTKFQIEVFFMLLQNAGSETTRNLITTGTLALLQHPDQLAWLRADLERLPRRHRGAAALRHAGDPLHPHAGRRRRARRASTIAAGERVLMVYASANRDERAFAEPDTPRPRPATPTTTWPSGPAARTSAWAPTWPGSRPGSCSSRSSPGSRACGSTATPTTFPRVNSNLIDGFAELPITWDRILPAS